MTKGPAFQTHSVACARDRFSALVSAAEKGQATLVAKRGKPVAMIVPINDARRLYPGQIAQHREGKPRLAEHLMSIPVPFVVRRSRSGMRRVDFLVEDQAPSDK